jgi:hypothetical protein
LLLLVELQEEKESFNSIFSRFSIKSEFWGLLLKKLKKDLFEF